jgi:hypothetical protein
MLKKPDHDPDPILTGSWSLSAPPPRGGVAEAAKYRDLGRGAYSNRIPAFIQICCKEKVPSALSAADVGFVAAVAVAG